MRPIMTRAELATHQVDQHGRDYSRSDDGYSDMEVAAGEGWSAVSGWGRDGYDLGDWPYVVISVSGQPAKVDVFDLDRSAGQRYHFADADKFAAFVATLRADDRDFYEIVQRPYLMRQTVEGDTTVYAFDSLEDRNAAIDYLFIWYGIGREYDEWTVRGVSSVYDCDTGKYPAREGLDAGTLRIPEELRGPFSWARCDSAKS